MRTFELTREHILLLRNANVDGDVAIWNRSPGLDTKRPFGNGDVVDDMARIIGVVPVETDEGHVWPKGTRDRMETLFRELGTALQVVLSSGSFRLGTYQEVSHRRWSHTHIGYIEDEQ